MALLFSQQSVIESNSPSTYNSNCTTEISKSPTAEPVDVTCVSGSICIGEVFAFCVNVTVCCGTVHGSPFGCYTTVTSSNVVIGQTQATINTLEDIADILVIEDPNITSPSQITTFTIPQNYTLSSVSATYIVNAGTYTINKSVSGWQIDPIITQ